ncbi:hypothetical protein AOL_s00083g21 [Orbilia oligospora ATCC 24927]|uniref:PDZ GRASP-type domain-containing protein n=3 Tax=Orbilia oligospora TaxID=2813651 RepID=G1XG91_ARTOA|nr:hypothetical protein AOL_s00083g21 [Orbilia oligospora ATCC 24927]EGX47809.1 hypothetical protein AOL_s00083g21 [Orbilia oligospora ATCC 24927]KAF3275601.1 hypothetical protein TWF970_006769 [Orbilia oligospora]
MGNEQSQVSGGHNRFGFRVLRSIKPEVPLEPWFDFICGINGREIDDADPRLFQEEVRNCAGYSVTLGVWSAKGQILRNITIPLPPVTEESPSPLGVSLKWMSLGVAEDVWHVLDISPGSPAEVGGLLPYSDYIIGTPRGVVRGESGLGELVEDHIDRPLQLYVYNREFNLVREVTILPRRHWGGDGALGCVLGYGALHRLPPPLEEPLSQPGEAIFEYPPTDAAFLGGEPGPEVTTSQDGSAFITPAFALQGQATSPPPGAPHMFTPSDAYAATRSPPPQTSTPPVMMDPAAIAALQSGRQTPSTPPQPPPMSSPYSQGQSGAPGGGPPPARAGRGKKAVRSNRTNLMDAYMMEEENKSKEDDYQVDAVGGAKSPPPPPGGARPPPPKKA